VSDGLVFYTNPMSRGRVARWMLEEIGQPYRTEILHFGTTMKEPAYLAINPMGKVPAIVHDGTVVTETGAICAYLADAFPHAGLAPPPGDRLRGSFFRWLFFGAGPLEAASVNESLGVAVPTERKRMVGYGSLGDVIDVLDAQLSRDQYLVGAKFTAADLYVGAQLGWLMQFGIVDKRPAFVRYTSALTSRPAAIRAREIDDALLPPTG
jgi:glutathione S-transferase